MKPTDAWTGRKADGTILTAAELCEIIRLHGLWSRGEAGGRRANLQGAYLQDADLQGADLQDADLRGAYLQGAYLQRADLQDAYLRGADLRGAYLRGADLRGADLQDADLDFSAWPLRCGSMFVKCSRNLAVQLAGHIAALAVQDATTADLCFAKVCQRYAAKWGHRPSEWPKWKSAKARKGRR